MEKLTLFVDESFFLEGKRPADILLPFYPSLKKSVTTKGLSPFENYINEGTKIYELTYSIEKADVGVLPNDYKAYEKSGNVEIAKQFCDYVGSYGKKTLVFYHFDSDKQLPLNNAIIFRTSIDRRKRSKNEFVLPGWTGDFLEYYNGGRLDYKTKGKYPVIGFCGDANTNPPFKTRVKVKQEELLGKDNFRKRSKIYRGKIINTLKRSPYITNNFILHKGYLGNAKKLQASAETQTTISFLRLTYIKNTLQSDYVFTFRGGGNFSYRFYETLALGRIPLLLDTYCVFPFEEWLNPHDYAVTIDFKDRNKISALIKDDFNQRSKEDFFKMQENCRRIWLEYFSPEGFFKYLPYYIEKNIL